jgi:hypothetical protein
MEEEGSHKGKSQILLAVAGSRNPRQTGKTDALSKVLAVHLAIVPDAKISLSEIGSERLIEQLPENVRTSIVIVESPLPPKPACPKCGATSRMALEFCKKCNFNILLRTSGIYQKRE